MRQGAEPERKNYNLNPVDIDFDLMDMESRAAINPWDVRRLPSFQPPPGSDAVAADESFVPKHIQDMGNGRRVNLERLTGQIRRNIMLLEQMAAEFKRMADFGGDCAETLTHLRDMKDQSAANLKILFKINREAPYFMVT